MHYTGGLNGLLRVFIKARGRQNAENRRAGGIRRIWLRFAISEAREMGGWAKDCRCPLKRGKEAAKRSLPESLQKAEQHWKHLDFSPVKPILDV